MTGESVTAERLRRAQAIELLNEYVDAVDSRAMQRWAALFAREASYSVVTRENAERGLPLALVMDHTRERIEDRVTSVTKVWSSHYNDYWPRHLISNVSVGDIDEGRVALRANFALYLTEPGSPGSRLLAVGRYDDEVTFDLGEW